jgi:hypothetical protein
MFSSSVPKSPFLATANGAGYTLTMLKMSIRTETEEPVATVSQSRVDLAPK